MTLEYLNDSGVSCSLSPNFENQLSDPEPSVRVNLKNVGSCAWSIPWCVALGRSHSIFRQTVYLLRGKGTGCSLVEAEVNPLGCGHHQLSALRCWIPNSYYDIPFYKLCLLIEMIYLELYDFRKSVLVLPRCHHADFTSTSHWWEYNSHLWASFWAVLFLVALVADIIRVL